MARKPCCDKTDLKKGKWTAEEDEKLINYINTNGEGNWNSLPKNAGLLRCGKSCRLRWMNYLRGDLKRGNFTEDEEVTIVKLHKTLGNKWSLIASQLPGRTDNEIKNYWNTHLRRSIYRFRSIDMSNLPSAETIKKRATRVKRALARKCTATNNNNNKGSCNNSSSGPGETLEPARAADDCIGEKGLDFSSSTDEWLSDFMLMDIQELLEDDQRDEVVMSTSGHDQGGTEGKLLDSVADDEGMYAYCPSPIFSCCFDEQQQFDWDGDGCEEEFRLWGE